MKIHRIQIWPAVITHTPRLYLNADGIGIVPMVVDVRAWLSVLTVYIAGVVNGVSPHSATAASSLSKGS